MKSIYTILMLMVSLFATGQIKGKKVLNGIYGAYMDYSTFTELTLNNDSTFEYYDQFELGETFRYYGKWKVKGQKLILYDSENNAIRPMPTKWKIKNYELISEKVKNIRTGKKIKIVLTYNEKKRATTKAMQK